MHTNDPERTLGLIAGQIRSEPLAPIGDGPNMAEKGTSLRHWGLIIRPTSIWVVP
jgi:hypothetical protein